MSIEREDGPVKHYRMICDSCGKQTKRFAYEFDFKYNAPVGWIEVDWEGRLMNGYKHQCPKCSSNPVKYTEEIIPNIGDGFNISDHDEVNRPLVRKSGNMLVIDCQDGFKLIITSDTKIKVEQTEEYP